MASGTIPPISRPPEQQPPPVEYEALIDRRLRQTRRQVKGVDLAAGLMILAAGTLAYLLTAAVIDHWIISGGMGAVARVGLFAVMIAGAGFYAVVGILPSVVRRVSPIFAAAAIEQSRPTLKNGLINFLFLRRQPDQIEGSQLGKVVYQSVGQKAAADLAHIPAEIAVDRSRIVRLGYLLVAILAVCCLYLVLSPKNPLTSFGRVIWPWADIKAPTRVTIEDVKPGDQIAYQGDTITVSAEVAGLYDDEQVLLYYTTADRQSVDQAIPMTVPEAGYRHTCQLPPGKSALQQDVEYYLAAGDCRTQRFKLEVHTALSILVDSVQYDYPAYTRIPSRVVQRVGGNSGDSQSQHPNQSDQPSPGDLSAIEGTQVEIRATANQQIDRAVVEMDCDPRQARRMSPVDSTTTMAKFTLRFSRGNPPQQEFESYQLRFTDIDGRRNSRPIRHRIEVIRDRPPEIQLVDPPPEKVELPQNGSLELHVRAQDPDFALRRVTLKAERGKRGLPISPLLDKPRPEPPHQGQFDSTYHFEPHRLELKAGDQIVYWAEAEDNKEPSANVARTAKRTIVILPPDRSLPDPKQPGDTQQAPKQPEESPDQMEEPQPQQEQPDEPKDEQNQDPEQENQTSEQPEESEQPKQPETQESGEDQPNQGETGEQGDSQSGDDSQSQQEPNQSDQPSPGQENGEQNSGQQNDGQQNDGQQSDSQQPDGSEGSGSKSQQPKAGERSDGQPNGAGGEPGKQPGQPGDRNKARRKPISGDTEPGDAFEEILKHIEEEKKRKEGDAQGGEPQGEPRKPKPGEIDEQSDPKQSEKPIEGQGERRPSDDQNASVAKPGEHDPNQQTSPEPKPGEKEPGEAEPGESGKPGEPTPGEREPEGQKSGEQEPDGQEPGGQEPGEAETGEKQPDEKGSGQQGSSEEKPEQEGSGQTQPEPGPNGDVPQRGKEGDQPPQSADPKQKDSDSEGDASGSQSGGGQEGSGQDSDLSGTGGPGSSTPADKGGAPSDQKGEGETGKGPGDQAKADQPTEGSQSEAAQEGESGQRKQTGSEGSESKTPGKGEQAAPGEQKETGQSSEGESGSELSSGSKTGGGKQVTAGGTPGEQSNEKQPEQGIYRGDEVNREYAQQQTNLALEYLEKQLAKDQPDKELLDRLGWTKEQLGDFHEQWAEMKQKADRSGSQGQARMELDDALESLGLTPHASELRGGGSKADRVGNLKEARRFAPLPDWVEAYQAYTRSLAESDE